MSRARHGSSISTSKPSSTNCQRLSSSLVVPSPLLNISASTPHISTSFAVASTLPRTRMARTARPSPRPVGLGDGLAVLAILVRGKVEATANEVDICGVDAEILSRGDGTTKELLNLWQFVELGFEVDILDPCLALDMLACHM